MEFELTKDEVLAAVSDKVIQRFVDPELVEESIQTEISKRVDKLFAERADALLDELLAKVFEEGLKRQFQRVDEFGEPVGEVTTLSKELARLTDGYWRERVNKSSGKRDSGYGAVTRAEFLMSQICAADFSKHVKGVAMEITLNFRDGLRDELSRMVKDFVDSMFRVPKKLPSRGKKPLCPQEPEDDDEDCDV